MTARFGDVEPLDIAHGLVRFRDSAADRVLNSYAGRSSQFELLIHVIGHGYTPWTRERYASHVRCFAHEPQVSCTVRDISNRTQVTCRNGRKRLSTMM